MAGGETVGKRRNGRRSNYRRDHGELLGEASSVGEGAGRPLVVNENETDFRVILFAGLLRLGLRIKMYPLSV
jgi:hypothetical protein